MKYAVTAMSVDPRSGEVTGDPRVEKIDTEDQPVVQRRHWPVGCRGPLRRVLEPTQRLMGNRVPDLQGQGHRPVGRPGMSGGVTQLTLDRRVSWGLGRNRHSTRARETSYA